ncbi:THO complex subunit 4A-like [Rosa rugosa]|uniref:THO complex subunit 4A-like n=1 Tax=Rosa rugosa TaxID=74645 RepID=UPI002B40CD58|nr:THO complex subunit 4A-like [Rosa rugosa]
MTKSFYRKTLDIEKYNPTKFQRLFSPEELFVEVGDLKRYGVHYDRSGRSKGTADVVFSRRQDAVAAVKRYNNVMLDGKPMKIEIVGTNIATPGAPSAMPPAANGAFRNSNGGAPRGYVLCPTVNLRF